MLAENSKTPSYWGAMFRLQCPRCRQGEMFKNKNPYKKFSISYVLDMHKSCSVCGQLFELETGFYYGTGYVSYGLTVAFSAFTFLLWWVVIGFSLHDNRLMYWLIFNAVLNLGLQPVFMRLSRWVYLNLFVQYNKNWKNEEGITFT